MPVRISLVRCHKTKATLSLSNSNTSVPFMQSLIYHMSRWMQAFYAVMLQWSETG